MTAARTPVRTVALLRGVNVGGVRFAMKDLAAALAAAGFTGVRTVLASGNVLVDEGPGGPDGVAAAVHAVIADSFGFDVAVVAVPLDTVREAAEAFPFDRAGDRHGYVVFATRPSAIDELAADAPDGTEESVRRGSGVLYWDVPKGRTLDSAFGKRLAKRVADGAVTTRNLNTLEKILAAG